MFYISDATKKPTPNQESASVPFLLEFEPAHGLRYILRQFDTFYTICSDLELPTNNAITFFETLSKRLKGLSKPSQQECYQYSQLLFLHFCYRQYLFPFPSLCQSDKAHLLVHRVRLAQGGKGEKVLAIGEMEEEKMRILVACMLGGVGQDL